MAALTEEQRELILELAKDKELSKAEIAQRAGVSRPTVYKVLREEGLLDAVSEEEEETEIHAGGGEALDFGDDGDAEAGEEEEDGAYEGLTDDQERRVLELYGRRQEESLGQVAEELELEPEDVRAAVEAEEEHEEPPAPIVLGSPKSAVVGLAVGICLGFYLWGLGGAARFRRGGGNPEGSGS